MYESEFIGVIREATTGEIRAVINPDSDEQLDNPRLLLLKAGTGEPLEMVKVPRGDYMGAMTTAQLAELVSKIKS
jgi:hypothetical protein